MSQSTFTKETLDINGIETVVHTAGDGDPLVFFHGAGTVDGFDFAEAWTDRFRVIVPYHPGFGESADDATMNEMHDYVMHYLELFDALGLDTFHLVGISMGGYLAAKFGVEHGHRIRRLGLIAPALMVDPAHPLTDILALNGEETIGRLVKNFDVLKPRLPENPGIDFIADRYRETTSLARIAWEQPNDWKLPRYLHRLKMPTPSGLGRGRPNRARRPGRRLATGVTRRQGRNRSRCRSSGSFGEAGGCGIAGRFSIPGVTRFLFVRGGSCPRERPTP